MDGLVIIVILVVLKVSPTLFSIGKNLSRCLTFFGIRVSICTTNAYVRL